uniref:3-ketoacyl-[acyl-carrier-protein] reductase beta subunit n=1 Tax=Adineta vaga TaxID=104782 RepID=B3G4A2_ADIVA|nr:short-chain dehydrogenase/reductase-like protein [Adineta vaga]
MGKLDGKVAYITGGAEGIGLATAQRFVIEGAYVFITDLHQEKLDLAVQQIGKQNITAIRADVSKLDDHHRVYNVIQREKGKLDIVFANAGIAGTMSLGSITEEYFDHMFNVNVKGVLFTVQEVLSILNDGSAIILDASIATIKGPPASSIYSATKAVLRSFARSWSVDLKHRHIRVNTISPGPIDTAMLWNMYDTEEKSKAFAERITTSTVLGRVGQPDEVARAVVFLASEDSSYVTGIELFVDGGIAQI